MKNMRRTIRRGSRTLSSTWSRTRSYSICTPAPGTIKSEKKIPASSWATRRSMSPDSSTRRTESRQARAPTSPLAHTSARTHVQPHPDTRVQPHTRARAATHPPPDIYATTLLYTTFNNIKKVASSLEKTHPNHIWRSVSHLFGIAEAGL